MKSKLIAATLALAIVPSATQAATYDLVRDFGSSVFSYGTGTGGTSFTAFNNSYSNCFGSSSFACFTNGTNAMPANETTANAMVPAAGQYSGTGAYSFGTPLVPNDVVYLHPGDGSLGSDVIVRFTAQAAGKYNFSGLFERIDSANGAGNGVVGSVFQNVGGVSTQLFSATVASAPYLSSTSFANSAVLGAGDSLDFVVNNNGGYLYDSTGLQGSINAVPEPAAWALMIGGFGLVGGALRVRSRKVRFA